ncbi:MAG: hypothetical protein ACW97P_03150 [Candidatus Hodarchaeales archaeon]|jgi:hypothetical protein
MEGGYKKPNQPTFADTHMSVVLYQKKESKAIQAKKNWPDLPEP